VPAKIQRRSYLPFGREPARLTGHARFPSARAESSDDADDTVDSAVGTVSIAGNDYGDIYADDTGGVLLVTRDSVGGGTLNCGVPANLCGTPPNPPIACYDMYMVRFDGTKETWATQLTQSSAAHPPYLNSKTEPTARSVGHVQRGRGSHAQVRRSQTVRAGAGQHVGRSSEHTHLGPGAQQSLSGDEAVPGRQRRLSRAGQYEYQDQDFARVALPVMP
jgi:hypothetical protein